MNKKRLLLFVTAIVMLLSLQVSDLKAQNNEGFTPGGKPFSLIFSDFSHSSNSKGNTAAFEISRAYFGYEYSFSKYISSKITLDVGDPGVGKLQMTAYLKNALIQYKKDNFSARFGMIGTDQFSLQEKLWGYRYIYKSFQDAYNLGPSADLGAAVEYSPAKFISLDMSVLNGEGYKKIQSDSTFKTTFGVTLRPYKGLVIRGYYDMMDHHSNQQTMSLFAGYTTSKLSAGFEYNYQKNNGMLSGHDLAGISAYSSLKVAEKFSVFARYDNLWSATLAGAANPWNYGKDGQLFMAGFDYSPVKGVRIAPNFQGWSPADSSIPFTSRIGLNFELKF